MPTKGDIIERHVTMSGVGTHKDLNLSKLTLQAELRFLPAMAIKEEGNLQRTKFNQFINSRI